MKSVGGAISTYCIVALIFFGGLLTPLFFLSEWSDRLGVPFWKLIVLGCTALSAGVFFLPKFWLPSIPVKSSLFVALAMTISIATVAIYTDRVRHDRIESFGPDEVIEHSFFRSIREAPREFQLFLHSAALKDCIAYGWSYRTMSFYRLPPSVVQNVVPNAWIVRCPTLQRQPIASAGRAKVQLT